MEEGARQGREEGEERGNRILEAEHSIVWKVQYQKVARVAQISLLVFFVSRGFNCSCEIRNPISEGSRERHQRVFKKRHKFASIPLQQKIEGDGKWYDNVLND